MPNKPIQSNVTPQRRASNFATATRQHIQTLPKQVGGEGDSLQFTLPKARLLSKITLLIEASYKATHASKNTVTLPQFAPYTLLRRIALEANTSFTPYNVSGEECAMYNSLRFNPDVLDKQSTNERGLGYIEVKASNSGVVNKVSFSIDLPVTLNDRDPMGLILLQNETGLVTVTVDINTINNAFKPEDGMTLELLSLSVTPTTETFTVPLLAEAYPDLSVLKLVHSKTTSIMGSGQTTLHMPIGTIYRKILLYLRDENGNPLGDEDLTGNIEIIFNQADIPYSLPARALAHRGENQLGHALPKGFYFFDFSNQGVPNFGGTRDYIDTEELQEFWIRFTTNKAGSVNCVYEHISRLA